MINPSPDTGAGTPLTASSEKLLSDFDRTPDAIDYSELSARLWMIERDARSRPATDPAGLDALTRAVDAALDEYPPTVELLTGWSPQIGRKVVGSYLAKAILARLSVADGPGPEERPDKVCPDCGLTATRIGEIHITAQLALPVHREETGR